MAEIQPFRAFRYDTHRVTAEDVLTQPYDKITAAMQDRYYALSPYNLIAVEKGRVLPDDTAENNVYTRAASKLDEWMAARILVQEAAPAIYIYSEEFFVPGTGSHRVRSGFVALFRIEDYDKGVVFRHEYTLAGPKPTASSCCVTRGFRRDNFFCSTTIPLAKSTPGLTKPPLRFPLLNCKTNIA